MKTTYYDIWNSDVAPWLGEAVEKIQRAGEAEVLSALERAPATLDGYLALLSPTASRLTGRVEAAARALTERRFGRTVNLYIPLYLSNACVNDCAYCWFGRSNPAPRTTLTPEDVASEAMALRKEGYRSLLLVSGEEASQVNVEYIAECVRLAKRMGFVFVGLEAQAMETDEYRALAEAGLDAVTIYQETYDPAIYAQVHKKGPKRDFRRRMEAPERAGAAGVRSIGMGVLLGLGDWRADAVALAGHVKHMQKHYWQTAISISFPRIHAAPGGFIPAHPVSGEEFVRLIAAMRMAFPDSILTLSTREAPEMRDRLFGMGINQVSAGSRTSPGAYSLEGRAEEQFPVVDSRTPAQVAQAIRNQGLEWVFKDWDTSLGPAPMVGARDDADRS